MLKLNKVSKTLSLLSVGALSVALFSASCDSDSTLTPGAGGAGGKAVGAGGAAGSAAGGAIGSAGGAGGTTSEGGAGGVASEGGAGGTNSVGGAGGTTSVGGAGGTTSVGGAGGTTSAGGAGGTTSVGGAGGTTSAGGAGGASSITTYNVLMNGTMEVLPSGTTASTASGQALITLDTATGAVTVSGSFSGLSSAATAAHIHGPAAAGAVADPIVVLQATAATSGTVTGTGTLTSAQVTAMLGGMTYINVHTSGYSGGEIRGQIK